MEVVLGESKPGASRSRSRTDPLTVGTFGAGKRGISAAHVKTDETSLTASQLNALVP
jgi:hypothetical protein